MQDSLRPIVNCYDSPENNQNNISRQRKKRHMIYVEDNERGWVVGTYIVTAQRVAKQKQDR